MKTVATRNTSSGSFLALLVAAFGAYGFSAQSAFSQIRMPFDTALPTIEFNSTAGDLGFHVELCGSPWKRVMLVDPDGKKIFLVGNQDSLMAQGITSLSFESAEPSLDELPFDEFLERFPEGEYTFVGRTIEGEVMISTAEFLHNIPDPPVIISPLEGHVVDPEDVVIAWEPVTRPAGIEIDVYQLQLFPVDPPEGEEPIALNIDLTFEVPSTITAVKIQPDLLTPNAQYEYEVIAFEAGGNRTITVGTFETAVGEDQGLSDSNDDDDQDDDSDTDADHDDDSDNDDDHDDGDNDDD
jgi:hypothetical protein